MTEPLALRLVAWGLLSLALGGFGWLCLVAFGKAKQDDEGAKRPEMPSQLPDFETRRKRAYNAQESARGRLGELTRESAFDRASERKHA